MCLIVGLDAYPGWYALNAVCCAYETPSLIGAHPKAATMTSIQITAPRSREHSGLDMDLSNYNRVPVDDILRPAVGRICYRGAWWVVTPENEVLFFKKYNLTGHDSPQCNTNKVIVDCWILTRFPECHVEWLPITFLNHQCNPSGALS